jgi:hypothetical protein
MVGAEDAKEKHPSKAFPAAVPAGLRMKVPVLCIGSIGQSGSTLLARMLGQVPGFVAVGETGRIWDKGLLEDMACGCGSPFRACEFWSQVGVEAFGGWDQVDAQEATRLRDHLTLRGRSRHPFALPLVLVPALSPTFGTDLVRYQELMGRLYSGIHRVSGGRTIVDSMKQPAHVYMVSRMRAVDPRVVHLVRDARGVAYSKTKWIHRQGAHSEEYRARRKPANASEKWLWMNLSFEVLPLLGVTTSRVRYESLVASPQRTLMRALHDIGAPVSAGDLGFIRDGGVELPVDHFAAGSRMRMNSGLIPLVTDEAWRDKLPPSQQRIVKAITWPLLQRYGYLRGGGD